LEIDESVNAIETRVDGSDAMPVVTPAFATDVGIDECHSQIASAINGTATVKNVRLSRWC
jgi:hypothetical protein